MRSIFFVSFLVISFFFSLSLDAWGLESNQKSNINTPNSKNSKNEIILSQRTSISSLLSSRQTKIQSVIHQNVLKELSRTRNEVYREYEWFKEETNEYLKRKKLISLFVKDLSSGLSGEVISNKEQRDSVNVSESVNGSSVSLESKVLGWVFVVSLNVGLLFYVYLFAMRQTQDRQSAWFLSFVMWFLFDFFIAGAGVILVTHLLIPLYIFSDIRTLKKKVLVEIQSFRKSLNEREIHTNRQNQEKKDKMDGVVRERAREFNSAKYFFTSWRIASLFPNLPESELILQFKTPWPKNSFKVEKKMVSRSYERRFSFVIQAFSRVFIFFFASLIHLPVVLQDSLIHFAINSGLGYVMILLVRLYEVNKFLPFVLFGLILFCIHFLSQSNQFRPNQDVGEEVLLPTVFTLQSEFALNPPLISPLPVRTQSQQHPPTDIDSGINFNNSSEISEVRWSDSQSNSINIRDFSDISEDD